MLAKCVRAGTVWRYVIGAQFSCLLHLFFAPRCCVVPCLVLEAGRFAQVLFSELGLSMVVNLHRDRFDEHSYLHLLQGESDSDPIPYV